MKLALNGALTIGTLDGANIEIREESAGDNIVIFGMTAAEVAERGASNSRAPRRWQLAAAAGGLECSPAANSRPTIRTVSRPSCSLLDFDRYMVAADFEAYWAAQRDDRPALADAARLVAQEHFEHGPYGWFSSDRTIREYAREIWNVPVD